VGLVAEFVQNVLMLVTDYYIAIDIHPNSDSKHHTCKYNQ